MKTISKLLLLTIASILSAKTLFVLYTDDYLGKCVIECGDIVVKHNNLKLKAPRCVTTVNCNTVECIEYTVNRYKHLYRTNGIGVEEIK